MNPAKIVNYILDPLGNLAVDIQFQNKEYTLYPCPDKVLEDIENNVDVYVDVSLLPLEIIHPIEKTFH